MYDKLRRASIDKSSVAIVGAYLASDTGYLAFDTAPPDPGLKLGWDQCGEAMNKKHATQNVRMWMLTS